MDRESMTTIKCRAIDAFEAKNSGVIFDCYMDIEEEAKRLQRVNAELLAACHANLDEWRKFALLNIMQQETVNQTKAAIAKATSHESTPPL